MHRTESRVISALIFTQEEGYLFIAGAFYVCV